MERKLELKDIAGNLQYNLHGWHSEGHLCKIDLNFISKNGIKLGNYKPILHPISDLYRTITHNGKEIVLILELAKIAYPNFQMEDWILPENCTSAYHTKKKISFWYSKNSGFDNDCVYSENQYQLFDYLHELKVDYRGLIDSGLAIDVNTLENNPYK